MALYYSARDTIVPQSFVGLLYEDGAFKRVLDPGKYETGKSFFSQTNKEITLVDMRERSLTIKGQELLTGDKAAIRISLLVYYKVIDPAAAIHNVSSYEERIYEDVQLAARRFVVFRKLDEILRDRNEISDAVRDDVKSVATTYGVEIMRADIKDLVFPGNLREMMNRVLETERLSESTIIQAKKDAEALMIRAEAEKERVKLELEAELEEAKKLEENPMLLKLRKIRALSDMAQSGGRFVVGLESTDLAHTLKKDD